MRIIKAFPPNYATIVKAIPAVKLNQGAFFTYGDVIYYPRGGQLSPALLAHEKVHSIQQMSSSTVEHWWETYLVNPRFRLDQELAAHREEYLVACKGHTRNQRRQVLRQIADRLAGPLYGKLVSRAQAQILIGAYDV